MAMGVEPTTLKLNFIPVKWSAPEILPNGLCTEMSDVVDSHDTK